MIKLTYDDGDEFFANPKRIERCGNRRGGEGGYVLFVGDDKADGVRETGEDVARLVAEAQRPAAGVDLEGVELRGDMNTVQEAVDCTIVGSVNVIHHAVRCVVRGNMNTLHHARDCDVQGIMNDVSGL